MAKYIIRYKTNQQFHDDQLAKAGKDVQPGQDIWFPVPGVSFTDEAKISDYNPLPYTGPVLSFINNTNNDGFVTLTAKHIGNDITRVTGNIPKISLDWSNDGVSFETKTSNDVPTPGEFLRFDLPAGGKLYLKGANEKFANGYYAGGLGTNYNNQVNLKCWSFSSTVAHDLDGVLSAIVSDEATMSQNYEFAGLFNGDANLEHVANDILPFLDVTNGGYARMFEGTSSLAEMPELPAENVGVAGCYRMFYNSGFETAKELSITGISSACCREMFAGSNVTGMSHPLPGMKLNCECYAGMFSNCTGLTLAPEIMATNAYPHCCGSMFEGCTSLVNPPVMHFDSFWGTAAQPPYGDGRDDGQYALACCEYMFRRCSSLVSTPTFFTAGTGYNYNGYAFQYMFSNCSSLVQAVELPFTAVGNFTYAGMFSACTKLETPPVMSKLVKLDRNNSLAGMFSNCPSLTATPVLNITQFVARCRGSMAKMFEGCTKITEATLPAVNLLQNASCYAEIFKGCSELSKVKAMFTTDPDATYEEGGVTKRYDYTLDWLEGVSTNGTFIKNASATWDDTIRDSSHIPAGWTVQTQ